MVSEIRKKVEEEGVGFPFGGKRRSIPCWQDRRRIGAQGPIVLRVQVVVTGFAQVVPERRLAAAVAAHSSFLLDCRVWFFGLVHALGSLLRAAAAAAGRKGGTRRLV